MRDYSFGNFISAQRERCGLSQYQLGALVGVSDKAVSKWENGASKPRLSTIRRLSDVFDISIDELLTCEYATFDKNRKDLFTMKNEILNIAKNRMKELYGENPPIRISNRFKTDEMILDGHEVLLWMGFFGKLKEKFDENNAYFEIRGAQMGASFIAWLLGGTNVNPLPAHYYCPVCKKVEFVMDEYCGLDLPDHICSCGEKYQKDGFGISEINMYPLKTFNDIVGSANTIEYVKKCMVDYFAGYGEVRVLNVIFKEDIQAANTGETINTRFALFSREKAKAYPEEVIDIHSEDYFAMLSELSVLSVLEIKSNSDDKKKISNIEYTPQQINDYFRYAIENDKFKIDYSEKKLDRIFSDIENPKFKDLIILYALSYGTGVWNDDTERLYNQGIPLADMIYCREDVYEYLYNKLNRNCCENPFGQVFEIKENLRKGKYSRGRMPKEVENLLCDNDVPKWYVESMKNILYLFPKTHIIAYVKRDIIKFLEMND